MSARCGGPSRWWVAAGLWAAVAAATAHGQAGAPTPPAGGTASGPASANVAPAGMPSDPFSAVAPARAAAEAARVRLSNARSEVADYVRTQRMLFENSMAYREAVDAQQRAWAEFDTARTKVLAALDVDPEVAALRQLLAETAGQLHARQKRLADSGLPAAVAESLRSELAALADLRFALSRQLSQLESAALRDDPATSEARERLARATREVQRLRQAFELELRTGEALAAGRRAVREAREQQAAAAEYAAAAARTADLLLDYAYYVQWSNQRRSVVVASPWVAYAYPLAAYSSVSPATASPGSSGIGYGMMPSPLP